MLDITRISRTRERNIAYAIKQVLIIVFCFKNKTVIVLLSNFFAFIASISYNAFMGEG